MKVEVQKYRLCIKREKMISDLEIRTIKSDTYESTSKLIERIILICKEFFNLNFMLRKQMLYELYGPVTHIRKWVLALVLVFSTKFRILVMINMEICMSKVGRQES